MEKIFYGKIVKRKELLFAIKPNERRNIWIEKLLHYSFLKGRNVKPQCKLTISRLLHLFQRLLHKMYTKASKMNCMAFSMK